MQIYDTTLRDGTQRTDVSLSFNDKLAIAHRLDDLGVSFIQHHTHRFGLTSKSFRDGRQLIGVENGCLCNLAPSYMAFPNWQHGFTVFYYKPETGRFQLYPVRIPDYKFFFGEDEFDYEEAHKLLYQIK